MSAKTTTDRKAGSAARGPRGLERLLIVAAVAAVLVAAGAWVAMNRPFGGAEAAAATQSSATASVGASDSAADAAPGTDTTTDSATGDPAAASAAQPAAGESAAAARQGSSGTGSSTGSSTGTSRPGTPAAPSSTATAPLSPTTAFLTALTASGLAPPVDDAQKLAMANDVCKEMGNGSGYDDVVRALTFAGASDAEAANFARLAITNICPQYKTG